MSVTMRSYDAARTGATTSETLLTPSAVKTRGIKRLFSLPTPGDARGCEAQPLVVPNVTVADGSVHTVVYLATMANDVYAYDAKTGALLWHVNFGTPIKSVTAIDNPGTGATINDHWGIISTPVIDEAAGILYACAWISPDGSGSYQTGQYWFHAIRLRDGSAVNPPLNLEGVTFDPGHGLPSQTFRSIERKQRAALLMANGAIFIGFGTIMETAQMARGWIIAIDLASWSIAASWCSTSRGSGGGIWMSGGGPAADGAGNIYVITGNGEFDGITDFGESVVKLKYVPMKKGSAASISVADWWTPWTDDQRDGKAAPAADRALLPSTSNFRIIPHRITLGALAMGDDWSDQDFGSGGPVLVSGQNAILAAGKDGILYTCNMTRMGEPTVANLEPAAAAAQNYQHLKQMPLLYTYFDPNVNPAPGNPSALNYLSGNVTHHLHGTPVLWQSATHGLMHFCGGENGNLRAWSLDANSQSTYLACSAEVASADAPGGGMPGWMISLSANGDTDGIVWALIPYLDANKYLSPGRFLAYDAQDFATYADGSKQIVPLWDSQDWGAGCAFTHPKFNRPVVFDGQVYVPTYDGRVDVYGLA